MALPAQWTFLGPQWIGQDEVTTHSIAVDHDWRLHCAFSSANQAVEVRKYDNGNWIYVAPGSLPPGPAEETVLEFDHLGIGYLAVGHTLALYKLDTVGWQWQAGLPNVQAAENIQLKAAFNGTLWLSWSEGLTVDTTRVWAFSVANGWQEKGRLAGKVLDLELDDQGMPIVLFESEPYIQNYNGTTWDSLPMLPQVGGKYLNIATAADGSGLTVFALHRDSLAGLSMDRFRNGQWLPVGNSSFANADEAELEMSLDGAPHVASVRNSIGDLPKVWKLNGNTWETVGGLSAYNNSVSLPLLAFDTTAIFLSFLDEEQDFRNSVMVLGGPLANARPNAQNEIQLYPNPAIDWIEIRTQKPEKNVKIRIVDAFGNQCLRQALLSGKAWKLDVSLLPAGSYFVILEGKNSTRQIGKFVKIEGAR